MRTHPGRFPGPSTSSNEMFGVWGEWPGRRGIMLFEVVLALAIFVGSFAAISQILRLGSRASIRAQLHTQAVLRCERKMNEVLAGIVPLTSVSASAFEDNSKWQWTLDVTETEIPSLLRVELLVEYTEPGQDTNISYELVRLVRDSASQLESESSVQSSSEVF